MTLTAPMGSRPFDVAAIKADFPILSRLIDGKPIVYLDSANSTQKPNQVIDAMADFMRHGYAPINRSSYKLAAEATDAYEGARAAVAGFIGAANPDEVVFTKNATESMNLIAHTWGAANLRAGDAIVLTHMEHHANIVPWQILSAQNGFEIRWIPLTDQGELDLTNLAQLLDGAKAVSFTAMSNVLGTLTPTRIISEAAHAAGAISIIDACQYVPHMPTNVSELGADLMAFSSHKILGPTGIGLLWGRMELLDAMPPFLGGGNMITDVRLADFTTAAVPHKFEAGTPPLIEAVGLHAAIDYLNGLGMPAVRQHEIAITEYALNTLNERFGKDITIYGPNNVEHRGATISFGFRGIHPHDVSQVLDQHNICVRAGHHCAKPLMRVLGAGATTRASFYIYNDESDVDALVDGLDAVTDLFF